MSIILIPMLRSGGYRSKVEGQAWKEYDCVACGCTYRSLIAASMSAQGKTAELADQRARTLVAKTISKRAAARPCPNCGCYQPDAEASIRRAKAEPFLFLPVIGLAVALLATPAQVRPLIWLAGVAFTILGVVVLVRRARYHVNANPRSAREKGQNLLRERSLELLQPGADPGPVDVSLQYSSLQRARLVGFLLVAGLFLFVATDVGLWISGVPLNLDCRPVVAGPGDAVQVYLPVAIHPVNGLWHGEGVVHIANAAELGLADSMFVARSQSDVWGSRISNPSNSFLGEDIWVGFDLPDSPNLQGRTLQVEATVDVKYPEMNSGRMSFHEVERMANYSTSITLSIPGGGGLQKRLWWVGTILGVVMILLGCLTLVDDIRSIALRAPAPRVYPADYDLL
ncbi:MAG TPA: hypothetical protein VHI13_01580 [Candidatus Kapabacteria bacterium]|nr:hypothetical protein [Candidatus Kapabacteria bacterium]